MNGQPATIGQVINPAVDTVVYRGDLARADTPLVYYALHKPRDIVTTCRQDGEKTILDIVDIPERVFPIGRLDKDSTGLILLTNDGRLSNYLMHPRYRHEKEYVVETYGPIDDEALARMSDGLEILGKRTQKANIRRVSSGTFSIVLREGRNRQIRRMVEAVGHTVKRLRRIRIENILLGDLPEGAWRPLTGAELRMLFGRMDIQ